MGKIMMANIRDEFVFKVIDPAIIPRYAEEKGALKLILSGMFGGLFFSMLLSFFISSIARSE